MGLNPLVKLRNKIDRHVKNGSGQKRHLSNGCVCLCTSLVGGQCPPRYDATAMGSSCDEHIKLF